MLRINLNAGRGWSNYSRNTVRLALPAGTRLGELASFMIEHDGAPRNFGEDYDTWKVGSVRVAYRPGLQCPIDLVSRAGRPLASLTGETPSWSMTLTAP